MTFPDVQSLCGFSLNIRSSGIRGLSSSMADLGWVAWQLPPEKGLCLKPNLSRFTYPLCLPGSCKHLHLGPQSFISCKTFGANVTLTRDGAMRLQNSLGY